MSSRQDDSGMYAASDPCWSLEQALEQDAQGGDYAWKHHHKLIEALERGYAESQQDLELAARLFNLYMLATSEVMARRLLEQTTAAHPVGDPELIQQFILPCAAVLIDLTHPSWAGALLDQIPAAARSGLTRIKALEAGLEAARQRVEDRQQIVELNKRAMEASTQTRKARQLQLQAMALKPSERAEVEAATEKNQLALAEVARLHVELQERIASGWSTPLPLARPSVTRFSDSDQLPAMREA